MHFKNVMMKIGKLHNANLRTYRVVNDSIIPCIRFFPCASNFRFVRENIKVVKKCIRVNLTQSLANQVD